MALAGKKQLAGFHVDYAEREGHAVGSRLLMPLPLLHAPDQNSLRADELADFQHVGVVRMRELDDLFLQHFLQFRWFDCINIEIKQECCDDSCHSRPGSLRTSSIFEEH